MKRKNAISKFFSEIGLLLATVVMMIPVYYFVISMCWSCRKAWS